MDYAIEFNHVSKIYKLVRKDKKADHKRFYALKDINIRIRRGEVIGILGTNGSGKSTLATILAGISEPDEGEVIVRGEQALIAINSGLNAQLTGLENIELKGALLGLGRQRINEIIDGVIEFAEIGEFLYQPVKKYSSGMKSRLGFAINLCLDPDVFIVDEALSVGDKGFAAKCLNRMKELRTTGKTIVFVSHTLGQVRDFCDTALWIEGGEVRMYGEVNEVCDQYSAYVDYLHSLTPEEKKRVNNEKFEKRILTDSKENLIDRMLTLLQKK